MPELPEVETIKNDLKKLVVGKEILGIEASYSNVVKEIDFEDFKSVVLGSKIVDVGRRAKSLFVQLAINKKPRSISGSRSNESGQLTKDSPMTHDLGPNAYLLIHLKMTGHFIVTSADKEVDQNGKWIKKEGSVFGDSLNQFIRIQFFLSDNLQMAFSDLRKFAYIKLLNKEELNSFLSQYGPEPLGPGFTVQVLTNILKNKKTAIKKVLMDQKNIAGIGNIYADEILFASRIMPTKLAFQLSEDEIEKIVKNTKEILKKSIELRGTSTSDYRDAKGEKGSFGKMLKVYRKIGQKCPNNCGGEIQRIVVGGRGTHFCSNCQR